MSDKCGRCAGHGIIQGIRFDMESSPIRSYEETCPQCDGTGIQPAIGELRLVALHGIPIALCLRHGTWAHYFDREGCWYALAYPSEADDIGVECQIVRGWPEVVRGLAILDFPSVNVDG